MNNLIRTQAKWLKQSKWLFEWVTFVFQTDCSGRQYFQKCFLRIGSIISMETKQDQTYDEVFLRVSVWWRLFRDSPLEVQSSSNGNICRVPTGQQEIPLFPWQRHEPAMEWRQPCPWVSQQYFHFKSDESLPLLESCYDLMVRIGLRQEKWFNAPIRPLLERHLQAWSMINHSDVCSAEFQVPDFS